MEGQRWASRMKRTHGKVVAGGPQQARLPLADRAVPHLHAGKLGGTTGEQDRLCNPGFQRREIKLQNLWLKKPMGVEVAGETPSLTGEFVGETHRVLECTQNSLRGNQHQKGPICLWVMEEVTENQLRAEQAALFSFRLLPHREHLSAAMWGAPPW